MASIVETRLVLPAGRQRVCTVDWRIWTRCSAQLPVFATSDTRRTSWTRSEGLSTSNRRDRYVVGMQPQMPVPSESE